MSTKQRQRRDRILPLVEERGAVSVDALAEMLGVSTQTIRRDLDALDDATPLWRRHGRVELAGGRQNTSFDQRDVTNAEGKYAIGAAAAEMIPDGATLFLSIGSTVLRVARALKHHKSLTVITNNLSAAMALSEESSNRIILPGGELRLPDRDIIGDHVLRFFDRYRAEFGVFSAAGISETGDLLEFHAAEIDAMMTIQQNSRQTIFVADHKKFGRLAPAAGVNIAAVDRIVLDSAPGLAFTPLLERLGDRIAFAKGDLS